VLPRWQGGLATITVSVIAVGVVILDIADQSMRTFWAGHALTADTVAGLLVLALTVLIVNQVLIRRQISSRARAVAAQAGILLAQGRRAVTAVLAVRDGDGKRDSAADELRSYLLMLLVSAPVLIEDPVARRFLELAQRLAAEMAQVLSPSDLPSIIGSRPAEGLDAAVESLRTAAAPLLAVLKDDEQSTVAELG
jgi:hypothetical protein